MDEANTKHSCNEIMKSFTVILKGCTTTTKVLKWTQEEQKKIMDDKIAEFRREGNSKSEAEELAKKQVAKPGYSEHQIGLAVDINGATYDLYFWLQENCYKYGFIFRYPGDKTDITGITEEVWHYRYVGVEAATEIHERGICLEEYLEGKRMKQ